MSAQRAANLAPIRYAPNTVLNIGPITWPASFNLDTKEAVFQIEKEGNVTFQLSSVDGGDIDVTGQVVLVLLSPNTLSVGLPTNIRFLDAIGELDEIEYRLDMREKTTDVTDFRLQGILNILESHGPYKAKT